MDSSKKWEKTVDSDDEADYFPRAGRRRHRASILTMRCHYFPGSGRRRQSTSILTMRFSEGRAPKEKRDPADIVPLFSEGCKQKAKRVRIEKRREKSVPSH